MFHRFYVYLAARLFRFQLFAWGMLADLTRRDAQDPQDSYAQRRYAMLRRRETEADYLTREAARQARHEHEQAAGLERREGEPYTRVRLASSFGPPTGFEPDHKEIHDHPLNISYQERLAAEHDALVAQYTANVAKLVTPATDAGTVAVDAHNHQGDETKTP